MFSLKFATKTFQFHRFTDLSDGEIFLELDEHLIGPRAMDGVPAYKFSIKREKDKRWLGDIDVRIGVTDHLRLYGGHIGYSIKSSFRGRRYAAKACNIISQVAMFHGMNELWITCNPDNLPSIRTCELIGAKYIDTVKVPENTEIYRRGDLYKCRYLWKLNNPLDSI